ncbi:fimbrial protein (plasmid) [Enterobacter asburiae]|uniref:fimbrial protein n=1 Tax=Enterobacter asburiae TaxID=61645 RepID=UPI0032AF449A
MSVMKIKNVIFFVFIVCLFHSGSTYAFRCKTANNPDITGGSVVRVNVSLKPEIAANENLVIDLSNQISCYNENPHAIVDKINVSKGSAYSGVLSNFSGTIHYDGQVYTFPLNSETHIRDFKHAWHEPWPVSLHLSPLQSASGVVISRGEKFATLILRQRNNVNSDDSNFTWELFSNNDVVMPVGGCDLSTRNISVSMGDYPIDKKERDINFSIKCGKNRAVSMFLAGKSDTSTIFSNVSSVAPSSGLGIEILKGGVPLSVNTPVAIGTVGTNPTSINLKARYALNGDLVKGGNLKSIIGINFTYN